MLGLVRKPHATVRLLPFTRAPRCPARGYAAVNTPTARLFATALLFRAGVGQKHLTSLTANQIEFADKDVDYANRIVLADPVFKALRKQGALPTIRPFNEALHPIPPQIARESYRANHIKRSVFTQPGSSAAVGGPRDRVRFSPSELA